MTAKDSTFDTGQSSGNIFGELHWHPQRDTVVAVLSYLLVVAGLTIAFQVFTTERVAANFITFGPLTLAGLGLAVPVLYTILVRRPGFALHYAIRGESAVADALTEALQTQLEAQPNVGTATPLALDLAQDRGAPLLLVDLSSDRLWTPVYARAKLVAQLYFAYDGDAPWPLDEAVVFDVSPAIKTDGEFTLTDRTMGLISKPAYNQHLAQNLASDIAAALDDDAFTRSSTTP